MKKNARMKTEKRYFKVKKYRVWFCRKKGQAALKCGGTLKLEPNLVGSGCKIQQMIYLASRKTNEDEVKCQ